MNAEHRPESLQERIATLIQEGHRNRLTSDAIAAQVITLILCQFAK